jgi:hypothetical protein
MRRLRSAPRAGDGSVDPIPRTQKSSIAFQIGWKSDLGGQLSRTCVPKESPHWTVARLTTPDMETIPTEQEEQELAECSWVQKANRLFMSPLAARSLCGCQAGVIMPRVFPKTGIHRTVSLFLYRDRTVRFL